MVKPNVPSDFFQHFAFLYIIIIIRKIVALIKYLALNFTLVELAWRILGDWCWEEQFVSSAALASSSPPCPFS